MCVPLILHRTRFEFGDILYIGESLRSPDEAFIGEIEH